MRSAHFRADIEEKESLIEELRSEMDSMKEEFAKVKKRNKQLAFIISQGESKLQGRRPSPVSLVSGMKFNDFFLSKIEF